MVYVTSGKASDARIGIASDLASRFKAKLIGFSARTFPADAFAHGPVSNDALRYETQRLASELELRGAHFRSLAEKNDSNIEWRSAQEFPVQGIVREARAADLLVIGTDQDVVRPQLPLDPAMVLLRAGRPVLIIPDDVRSLPLEKIVIAWKDTREARRVVADALPFLQRAKGVAVVAVGEGSQLEAVLRMQLDDVSAYLAGHAVIAESKVIQKPRNSVGEEIIHFAKTADADLVVAGAYGRSQIGEWIFGGVTETLLMKSPIACFLSH